MRKFLLLTLTIIVVSIFGTSFSIVKGEDQAQESLSGFWSSQEDCNQAESLGLRNLFYGGRSGKYLEIFYESSGYREVSFIETKQMEPPLADWWKVDAQPIFFVKFSNDGVRKIHIVFPPEMWNGLNLEFLTEVTAENEYSTYFECEGIRPFFELEFGELISLGYSNVYQACSAEGDSLKFMATTCVAEVFRFLDIDGNSELHPAEITRGIRTILLYAVSSAEYSQETSGYFLASVPFLPLIATSIIANMDYDGSGSLSLFEISQDRTNIIESYGQAKDTILGKNIQLPKLLENLGPWINMLNQ